MNQEDDEEPTWVNIEKETLPWCRNHRPSASSPSWIWCRENWTIEFITCRVTCKDAQYTVSHHTCTVKKMIQRHWTSWTASSLEKVDRNVWMRRDTLMWIPGTLVSIGFKNVAQHDNQQIKRDEEISGKNHIVRHDRVRFSFASIHV